MTSLPLRDFPLKPSTAIIVAPQNTASVVISRSGFENHVPVMGARNQMRLTFQTLPRADNSVYAWLANNLHNVLFKVPVFGTPQLPVSDAMLAAQEAAKRGLPFSTGETFANGRGFRFSPTLDVTADAAKGSTTLTVDTARWPGTLTYGKVIGINLATYHVDDIELDGDVAALTVRPPLRRDYVVRELVRLRPYFVGKVKSGEQFIAAFRPGGLVEPGSLTLNEYIDDRFL